jgi:hypothetical protein
LFIIINQDAWPPGNISYSVCNIITQHSGVGGVYLGNIMKATAAGDLAPIRLRLRGVWSQLRTAVTLTAASAIAVAVAEAVTIAVAIAWTTTQ